MMNSIPHNVLTISEMTRRKNRINAELMHVEDVVLTDDIVKKLRASSSLFNKTTYIQLLFDGVRYNVESIGFKKGFYKLSLISPTSAAVFRGEANQGLSLESKIAI